MQISEETIAAAALDYFVFAFDEGTPNEIRQAKTRFNDLVSASYRASTKSALMGGFHRPNDREFRAEFIDQCRKYLRRTGKL